MSQELSQKSQEPEIITNKEGKPFETERAAQFALEKKNLKGTHEVVPAPEGNGFLISKKKEPTGPVPYKEKYFFVTFSAKTDKYQPDDIVVTCNSEILVMQRTVKTIVPQRFLGIIDCATYPELTQKPGQPRKIVAYVTKYPYMNHGEATEQEFNNFRNAGNRKTEEFLKSQGITKDLI